MFKVANPNYTPMDKANHLQMIYILSNVSLNIGNFEAKKEE